MSSVLAEERLPVAGAVISWAWRRDWRGHKLAMVWMDAASRNSSSPTFFSDRSPRAQQFC